MDDSKEQVILVDEHDMQIGLYDKLQAHKEARLHRAFSIFIFDSQGRFLLQYRDKYKYHGGNLWVNTACGHPRDGETVKDAAERRLREEMGISSELTIFDSMIYKTPVSNGLTEHEYLYLLSGRYDGHPLPDYSEASGYRWIEWEDLQKELEVYPELYAPWFTLVFKQKSEAIRQSIKP